MRFGVPNSLMKSRNLTITNRVLVFLTDSNTTNFVRVSMIPKTYLLSFR